MSGLARDLFVAVVASVIASVLLDKLRQAKPAAVS